MIDFKETVAAVFELINCGVIIGLITYVFKKYLLGIIYDQMRAQSKYIDSLKESFHMLTRNYQLLDREIEYERQVQYELKEKVMRWRANVEQLHEQRMRERDERKKIVAEQAIEQNKQVQKYMIYDQVLPRAIQDARAALEKQCADPEVQKKYLSHSLNMLRKGSA